MRYENSKISHLIDEYIHVAWQRDACKMKLCDGCSYAEIAKKLNYSEEYVKEIVLKNRKILMEYL